VGDPLEENTEIGPLARGDLRDDLHRQVLASVDQGAKLILGGELPPDPGYYYPPTILTRVAPGMPAYDEELFGPVATVIGVQDVEAAVRVANDTPYGLGGSVWGRDAGQAEAVAARIEAGAVFVNGLVKSDPRLPFGGVKASGYGRELSVYGIREFVNIQSVWIK
jgi:succinate-semialdehyde dehydrogenase/glutarate-semialdehyde dehydrogenase